MVLGTDSVPIDHKGIGTGNAGSGAYQTDGLVRSVATRRFSDVASHPFFIHIVLSGRHLPVRHPRLSHVAQVRGLALILIPVEVRAVWDSMLAISDGSAALT
ncbi:hypothetical protein CH272_18765 [Rhodococcus sp. 05-340-1]|nr:hypothetical protein CH254_14035 [Rhodococcus sp. 06-412-2C]OZC96341.1 hypothetical protein CH279_14205 [Rhodococcus sp. 06-412-2B]OZD65324.1 hypothetical protein CH271_20025 [Rhodococcus sp. 05-340-2]OZD74629.1 hypothetical protein CH272_18765 [Rhodococcus sp. 05-340-1]